MEVRLVASNVLDSNPIETLLRSNDRIDWKDEQGLTHNIHCDWQGPRFQNGLWENFVEWKLSLDLASIPIGIATGVVANYLWRLIEKGSRPKQICENNEAIQGKFTNVPPFIEVSNAKLTLVSDSKQVEIDPLCKDFGSVLILVGLFFDDKDNSC